MLVQTVAGDELLGDGFERHVASVRAGTDPEQIARIWYVPRNATRRRREIFKRLLEVAAAAGDRAAAVEPLLRACRPPISGRHTREQMILSDELKVSAVVGDPAVVFEPGDRQNALQERWRIKLGKGARLLALRGDGRCLMCERTLDAAERRRERAGASTRRVLSDYCDSCEEPIRDSHLAGDLVFPDHVEQIRTVLDAAAPAVLAQRPCSDSLSDDELDTRKSAERGMTSWTLEQREAWLAEAE